MPNDFTLIYKILRITQKGLDYPTFSLECFNLEKLGVNQVRFENIMIMLQNDGFIRGLEVCEFTGGRSVNGDNIRLTMQGLEYLEENSLMKKAKDLVGNIAVFL